MTPHDRETITRTGSVTPERFARVRAIFEAAVERPAGERRGYVAGACGDDGALLREVEAMLAADAREEGTPSSAPEEGRFPAGTVLAGRYRILGLLGKGGMGEVYKAFDLILNQTVALKFLSARGFGEAALVRFRNEVRIARQVSHPNVCRVYDLGMVEGLHFLSMEYIDGEDLASLLRRIGRLPQDKAIEFTRKICAGLAAAHERGVLHRDLKPANIMIDGRGQPRITDFGLAGLAAEIPLSDLRSGTPAYMSPEQKAGKEVTTRSDIYSLGLVLHEMFTGKARKDTQSSPSEVVKDLDSAIDRLILRCLEEDPKRRPNSALNVAMALPGADPIAAALAAGETPSPEMVAASTEKEGFSIRTGAICFAGVLVCLVAAIVLESKYGFFARAPLPLPPDALADRVEQLLSSLGYGDQPGATEYGFFCCDNRAVDNLRRYEPAVRGDVSASGLPPIAAFYYRRSVTLNMARIVLPANEFPDAADVAQALLDGIHVILNPRGRLVRLEVRRPELPPSTTSPDWNALLLAAGLDPSRFTPAMPEGTPSMAIDHRQAWNGTYGDHQSEHVHVEAASWQGHPVLFDVQVFPVIPSAPPASFTLVVAAGIALISAGAITASRNLRLGRGDRRGAAVIASIFFLSGIAVAVLGPSHTNSPVFLSASFISVGYRVGVDLLLTVLLWATYIAIEPYLRRHWPDALISWTRFTNGRLRNSLVASHILVAVVAAKAELTAVQVMGLISGDFTTKMMFSADAIDTAAHAVAGWLSSGNVGIFLGLGTILMAVLLRLLLRQVWIADLAGALIPALVFGVAGRSASQAAIWAAFYAIVGWTFMQVLKRFGFLSVIGAFYLMTASFFPITATGWFAGRSLTIQAIPVVIALWALWVIVTNKQPTPVESAD